MKFQLIQALRAVAATLVVVFHAQALCHKYASGASHLDAWLGGAGQYGVDLFFVLSGFVIQYTLRRTPLSAGEFLRRRLIRIVPIYWIVTAASLLLLWVLPGTSGVPLDEVLRSFTFTAYALNTTQHPIIYVGWTLEYEMLFYLLVWVLLLVKLPVYRSVGVIFLALYALLQLLLPQSTTPGHPLNFLSSPLLFEFLFGVFLAERFVGRATDVLDWALPGLALLLVAAIDPHSRLLFAGAPAALLVWLALTAERRLQQRATHEPSGWLTWLARLGDASYSIYLLQVIALPAIGKAWQHLVPAAAPDLLVGVATLLVVACGCVLYTGVERPVLKILQRLRLQPLALQTAVSRPQ